MKDGPRFTGFSGLGKDRVKIENRERGFLYEINEKSMDNCIS
jgi:hypothetical protein